ncbi:hypothetical protein E2C01_034891 [Portunus trituberculatus]|uniref:Uncharacterized protein n=1 Tax=Portunus trituberculatus TaxID=210409 RepID=A0A5B7F886_PORTR|nr:hypothetical protein [Portunus trituberculatus]
MSLITFISLKVNKNRKKKDFEVSAYQVNGRFNSACGAPRGGLVSLLSSLAAALHPLTRLP